MSRSFRIFNDRYTTQTCYVDSSTPSPPTTPFISEWTVTDANKPVELLFYNYNNYDFRIDWGDGTNIVNHTTETIHNISRTLNTDGLYTAKVSHTYAQAGVYTITITGSVPKMRISTLDLNYKVTQLGNCGWTDLNFMFYNTSITSLNTEGAQYSPAVSCLSMCSMCEHLGEVDTVGLTNIMNCSDAWNGCIVLTNFNTQGLTNVIDFSNAWYGCIALENFNASGLTNVIYCSNAWRDCSALENFNASGLTSVTQCSNAWNGCSALTDFNASGLTSVTQCSYAWNGCSSLTDFNTQGLTSVTQCLGAWRDCSALENFNAIGLTSVTNCINAWLGTGPWNLGVGGTFTFFPQSLTEATGWNPSTDPNGNPYYTV